MSIRLGSWILDSVTELKTHLLSFWLLRHFAQSYRLQFFQLIRNGLLIWNKNQFLKCWDILLSIFFCYDRLTNLVWHSVPRQQQKIKFSPVFTMYFHLSSSRFDFTRRRVELNHEKSTLNFHFHLSHFWYQGCLESKELPWPFFKAEKIFTNHKKTMKNKEMMLDFQVIYPRYIPFFHRSQGVTLQKS